MAQNKRKTGGNAKSSASCPRCMQTYAKQAPKRLRAISDDPETPVKVKIEIEKWFFETVFGKDLQRLEQAGNSVEIQAMDLSKFSDEELLRMAEEADE